MHVKRIHEMIEKLTECAKTELDRGIEQVDVEEFGAVADMIKDLCEAEKSAKIVKQMEECEEEEKKSDEYFLRMLKEEYGDEEGKRYYDNYRYRSSGRFAPKGRGSYSPRRNYGGNSRSYEEMPYYFSPEWYRDMDRMSMNRLYYSGGGSSGGNTGGGASTASSGSSGGNGGSSGSGGSSMGYSESVRNYDDGYSRGYSDGQSSRSRNESRSERARRNYTETKEMHKGNNASDKQANMKELENYFLELGEDMSELIKGMSPEERNMAKQKITTLASKI